METAGWRRLSRLTSLRSVRVTRRGVLPASDSAMRDLGSPRLGAALLDWGRRFCKQKPGTRGRIGANQRWVI